MNGSGVGVCQLGCMVMAIRCATHQDRKIGIVYRCWIPFSQMCVFVIFRGQGRCNERSSWLCPIDGAREVDSATHLLCEVRNPSRAIIAISSPPKEFFCL